MQKQIFKQRKASGEEQNRFKRKKKKNQVNVVLSGTSMLD